MVFLNSKACMSEYKPFSRVIPVPRTPGPLDVVPSTQSALQRSKIQDPRSNDFTSFTTDHQPTHVLLARINPLSALSVWPTESNTRPRIQICLDWSHTGAGSAAKRRRALSGECTYVDPAEYVQWKNDTICRYHRCLAPTSRHNLHEVIAPSGLRVKPVACGRNQTSELSTKGRR